MTFFSFTYHNDKCQIMSKCIYFYSLKLWRKKKFKINPWWAIQSLDTLYVYPLIPYTGFNYLFDCPAINPIRVERPNPSTTIITILKQTKNGDG